MKIYKGSFIKKNGEIREMIFAHLDDLPDDYLESRIIGASSEKQLPKGMELVWDIEADNFRVFNWSAVIEHPQLVDL